MKPLIPIMLALLTLLAGCEPEVARVEEPTKAELLARNSPKEEHVICPLCKGEKLIKSKETLDGVRQACPVCIGRGFRDLKVPSDKMICPDCKGMGLMISASTGPDVSANILGKTTCSRCIGSGLTNKSLSN